MLVAYLTTDEVNLHYAAQLAEARGDTVHALTPREAPADGPCDAALYDWDFLPAPERQAVLRTLLTGFRNPPAAVHGCSLCGEHKAALRRKGVVVSRKLEPRVFRALAKEAARRAAQDASANGWPHDPAGHASPVGSSQD